MNIGQSLLLGIVQGATEFLPVSSSGHLYLAEAALGLAPNILFAVWVHGATLLAVILVYWREIWQLLKGLATLVVAPRKNKNPEGLLALQLLLSTAITVGVALLLEPIVEHWLTLVWVSLTLMLTGVMILLAEKLRPSKPRSFNALQAIGLGLVQGIAVVPGISRSGITIAWLIGLGIERRDAAKLSFLLSIPTIAGALVFMLAKEGTSFVLTPPFIVGGVAAFITAVLAIYAMKSLVERHWIYFAPYCVVLGLVLLASQFLA